MLCGKEGDVLFFGQLNPYIVWPFSSDVDDRTSLDDVRCSDGLAIGEAGQKEESGLSKGKDIAHHIGPPREFYLKIEIVFTVYDFSGEKFFDVP